ncbi:32 kDa beta-galactoside-binding lectin-like [Tiliqua scincoides]|uniref:32 kDa beta-galactoside-binding lectin-like n=1 Tax=Tiliqua scincoides TaxID=71010 RepID=UPI0034633BFA
MARSKSITESNDIELLEEGETIWIKARVLARAKSFSVALACLDKTIPFHFSTQFDEDPPVVICNTNYAPVWGTEERTCRIPFQRGEFFEMTITIRTGYYEVSVNGRHFLDYEHRLPFRAQKLWIRGDITAKEVSYLSNKALCATFSCKRYAESFSVNLKCENGDIAFHFNPRFDEKQPVVVCNTCTEDKWGLEERTFQMPFHQGESFEMTITTQNSYYEVSVNGENILKYKHRLPFHTVTKLEFYGDIKFEENGSPLKPEPPCVPPLPNGAAAIEVGNPGKVTPEWLKLVDLEGTETRSDSVDVTKSGAGAHMSGEFKIPVSHNRRASRDHSSNKHESL